MLKTSYVYVALLLTVTTNVLCAVAAVSGFIFFSVFLWHSCLLVSVLFAISSTASFHLIIARWRGTWLLRSAYCSVSHRRVKFAETSVMKRSWKERGKGRGRSSEAKLHRNEITSDQKLPMFPIVIPDAGLKKFALENNLDLRKWKYFMALIFTATFSWKSRYELFLSRIVFLLHINFFFLSSFILFFVVSCGSTSM